MANEDNLTTSKEEEYLYLYKYTADGKPYTWFSYFRNRQEAEATITFWNTGVSYIKSISLEECKHGVKWNSLHIPHKKSDWERMRDQQNQELIRKWHESRNK